MRGFTFWLLYTCLLVILGVIFDAGTTLILGAPVLFTVGLFGYIGATAKRRRERGERMMYLALLLSRQVPRGLTAPQLYEASLSPSSGVYPILGRLERCGWVQSDWAEPQRVDGSSRSRAYRLTELGEREIKKMTIPELYPFQHLDGAVAA